jgi:hypothetical protein
MVLNFQFQGSTDGGSNYGVTKTTTAFSEQHMMKQILEML